MKVQGAKVEYRGIYISKRAKMLLFTVNDIMDDSYEVTF